MLKVALLGAGTMGRVHSASYKNIGGAALAAVCDIETEKARALADMHGARYYSNFEDMMSNEDIDVVDICLPTYLHKDYALKSMDMGKHVFCEKPIALKIEDAKEMVDKSHRQNVNFSVGHVVRFFPAYARASEIIKSGSIGTPKLIRTTRTGAYPSWSSDNWYSNYDLSGGPIVDLVIHDFDWICHNLGDVSRVYARDLYSKKLNRQDHCLITLRLKNGMIAHVEGSWAYPKGSIFGMTFEIIGTEGQIEYDSRESSPIKKHLECGESVNISIESPLFPDQEPYTAELQEFISSIIECREPKVSGADAIKALEISLAAAESARCGRVVFLGGDNE